MGVDGVRQDGAENVNGEEAVGRAGGREGRKRGGRQGGRML